METIESQVEDEEASVSIPRGGPIYVPDLVSSLTRVPDFQSSIVQHLENLRAEIDSDLSEACGEDISVGELKIFSEEELVNEAFKEAFKDSVDAESFSSTPEGLSNEGRENYCRISSIACLESSGRVGNASSSFESSNGSSFGFNNSGTLSIHNYSNTTKRRKSIANQSNVAENGYIAKVEQLAKIKKKQDEDKAAARLHSFNGSCKINECPILSSEKVERMKFLRSTSSETKVKPSNIHELKVVSYPEVVLCVDVYHGKRNGAKAQEFLVLGRQTLTELRDRIYCLTDEIMKKAGQHDPSGYFLIEDVFCNDLRDPCAIDYSKPIFDWLSNSKDKALEKWECIISGVLREKHKAILGDVRISHLPRFRSFDMQKMRFCDLKFRLGAGYLYCHQGDCKHVIVIRDMRLIHPEDITNLAAYPITIFQQKLRFQKCCVCKIYRATKVTVDDKWALENPCYFCDKCYFLLHYSEDGSLLYNEFSVYDYYHE